MAPIRILITVTCLMLAVSASSRATMIQYREGALPNASYAHLGAEVRSYAVTSNFGADVRLRLGRFANSGIIRSLLAFALTDVPPQSYVSDISLLIPYAGLNELPSGTQMVLYPIAGSALMVESEVTWNQRNAGTPWATPGGDYDVNTPLAVFTVSGGGALTFLSTANFLAAANAALVANQPLQMLLMCPWAEAQPSTTAARYYLHSDNATTIANRPLLAIGWTAIVPEPGSATLFGLAALTLVARRRRCR